MSPQYEKKKWLRTASCIRRARAFVLTIYCVRQSHDLPIEMETKNPFALGIFLLCSNIIGQSSSLNPMHERNENSNTNVDTHTHTIFTYDIIKFSVVSIYMHVYYYASMSININININLHTRLYTCLPGCTIKISVRPECNFA